MNDNHISYIEFKTKNLSEIKNFYTRVFSWEFTDYGPTYTSFAESGVYGGFETSEEPVVNGVLVVLYHSDLDAVKSSIIENGGTIVKDIFSFPGGKRFHFQDPDGNELAVWSE